jgi:hypothetical protein
VPPSSVSGTESKAQFYDPDNYQSTRPHIKQDFMLQKYRFRPSDTVFIYYCHSIIQENNEGWGTAMSNKRKSACLPTHFSRCNQFASLNSAGCDRRAVLNLTTAHDSLTTSMTHGRLASVLSTAGGWKNIIKLWDGLCFLQSTRRWPEVRKLGALQYSPLRLGIIVMLNIADRLIVKAIRADRSYFNAFMHKVLVNYIKKNWQLQSYWP